MTTSSKPKSSWRDVLPIHPAADLFPMMTPDELKALGDDIRKQGQRIAIAVWKAQRHSRPELLDGRNRLDAMEAVGIAIRVDYEGTDLDPRVRLFKHMPPDGPWWPIEIAELSGVDPYNVVLSANLHRRHLTAEQKRDLIANLLKATPQKSNRQIAEAVKVDHKTVASVRAKEEARGEIPRVETRTDTKGRQQQAHQQPKKKRRDIDDYIAEKKVKMAAKAERRAEREVNLAKRITELPNKCYAVIYPDPPWRFEPYSRETGMDRAADNHYPTMTTAEIAAMDVASITADDAALFLWATSPMLAQALEVMKAWGFSYRSHIVWDKGRVGTGFWVRNRHELLLIGTRGNVPAPVPGTQPESIIAAPVGAHSAKPECFAELIERLYPTVPKIELFRRGAARPGWDAWGNEVAPPMHQPDDLAIPEFLRRQSS